MTTDLANTVPIDVHNPEHALLLTALIMVHEHGLMEIAAFAAIHGAEPVNRGTWHPTLLN